MDQLLDDLISPSGLFSLSTVRSMMMMIKLLLPARDSDLLREGQASLLGSGRPYLGTEQPTALAPSCPGSLGSDALIESLTHLAPAVRRRVVPREKRSSGTLSRR